MTVTRRLLTAVAGLSIAALALSGCLYSAIPAEAPRPTGSTAPDTEGVAEDLLPYYGQDVDWEDCGTGLDCATITAPLDWDDPSADSIDLAIVRHRAESGSPIGSLLMNPGGPGVGGYDYVHDYYSYLFGPELIEQYDLIGFDPRGVGLSTSVKCFDAPEMDAYLFDLPTAARGTQEWYDELLASSQSFADACEANSGGILPYINTVSSARDMDLIRAVLGEKQLDYLGFSYGTLLGAVYAELYPEKVGRLVLDGAVDPALPPWEDAAEQAGGFESAMRSYLADCLEQGDACPFRGTVDQAIADVGTLLASLDAAPLTASDGRRLNANGMIQAIVTSLYAEWQWPDLTQAFTDVLQGDADSSYALIDSYYDRVDGVYTANSTEAFTAYLCMDNGALSPEDTDKYDERVAEVAPTFAPYYTGGPDGCSVWPYPPVGVPTDVSAEGAAPIVVIGTTGDPATPYQGAVDLADELSSGVLITRVGEGHTGYMQGNDCVDEAVDAYLVDGTVPEDGLTCD